MAYYIIFRHTSHTPVIVLSTMFNRLGKTYVGLLLVILFGVVVHAPLSVSLGSLFPDQALFIKAWKEILMLIAGVVLIALIIIGKEYRLLKKPLILMAAAYAALHFVNMFRGYGWESVLSGLIIDLRYVFYFVLVYFAVKLFPRYRTLFMELFLLGGIVVVGFAVLQNFALPPEALEILGYGPDTIAPYLTVDLNDSYIRINSTLRGPNPLGAYAASLLIMIYTFWLAKGSRLTDRAKYGLAFFAIGGLVALWSSYSRSAVIGLAVGLAVVMIYLLQSGRIKSFIKQHKSAVTVIAMALISISILTATNHGFVSNVVLHENPSEASDLNSNEGHLSSLTDGFNLMLKQPFGKGVGSTGSASLFTDQPLIIENQYLFIAHEIGWLGIVLFLAIFLFVQNRLWAHRHDWLALGLFASGWGLAVVGLLLPVWVDDTVSIIWWGMAALVLASGYKRPPRHEVVRIKHVARKIREASWKKWLKDICVLLMLVIIFQLIYPSGTMPLASYVDDVNLGGKSKADAIKILDDMYADKIISINLGSSEDNSVKASLADLGIVVDNSDRIEGIEYNWYWRLVPSSIFWFHTVNGTKEATYDRDTTVLNDYVNDHLMTLCGTDPVNAKVVIKSGELTVEKSKVGLECDSEVIYEALSIIKPTLGNHEFNIDVKVSEKQPDIQTEAAESYLDGFNKKIVDGLALKHLDDEFVIKKADLLGWLSFTDDGMKIYYKLDEAKLVDYLNKQIASKIESSPGVTYVTTYNFVEKSRTLGETGYKLDAEETVDNIQDYLSGKESSATIVAQITSPSIVYKRTYSSNDEGLTALITNYAKDHGGTYGVSMIEIGGSSRKAGYNENKVFTTASTYKLFVAYSTLLRVESGAWSWSDYITGGRNLASCFDYMITNSDNACAEALLWKIGYNTVTNEAHALGCTNTNFKDGNITSTPADLALFLGQLQSGGMLSQQSSRDKLINAMKNNIYRSGVPAGIPSATVADKVGFLWGLLHDATIVYSPSGTYVLVIMTNNQTWGNIAELAGQIETLRNQ